MKAMLRGTLIAAATTLGLLTIGKTAAAQQSTLPSRRTTSRTDPFKGYIAEASQRFGVPEAWIRAVMRVESAGEVGVTSSAGAMGLMQVMPQTYATLRAKLGLGANAYDPHDNIMAGAAFLRDMHDRYGDAGFLAAYNAGSARYEEFRAGGRALRSETILYMARLGPMLGLNGGVALAVSVPSVVATPEAAPIFVSLHGNVVVVGLRRNSTSDVQLAAADAQAGDRAAGLFTSRVASSDRTPESAERVTPTPISKQPSSAPSPSPAPLDGQRDAIFVKRPGNGAHPQPRCRSLSCGKDQACPEQVELCSPVSLAFDQLEAGDLSLDLAAAPGQRQGCAHRLLVHAQASGKAAQLAVVGIGQPGGEGIRGGGTYKSTKALGDVASRGQPVTARMATVALWAVLSQAVVLRRYVWLGLLVPDTALLKSGRTGWQDGKIKAAMCGAVGRGAGALISATSISNPRCAA